MTTKAPAGSSLEAIEGEASYEFGNFRIDPSERRLLRDGVPVPLTTKAFDTLLLLVQRSNHLVEKSEIMSIVWPDSFVEEGNLSVTVWMLRKALGGSAGEGNLIQTVPKRGFRFVADVKEVRPPKPTTFQEREAETLANQPGPGVPMPAPAVSEFESTHAHELTSQIAPKRLERKFVLLLAVSGLIVIIAAFSLYRYHSSRQAAANIHSIAVLPFQTLHPAKDQDYLGLEIADAVITKLGSSGRMQVRPTSAVLGYSRSGDDPRAIGRAQRVDAVLVGSMEQSPERIRVNVQLIRVADGSMLWAKTFDEASNRMFALEDAIGAGIDGLRSIPAAPAFVIPAEGEEVRNPAAYHLYLHGRYFWNKRTEDGLRRGIDYFKQAIAEDNQYAEAYSGLADSYALLVSYGIESGAKAYPLAEAAALKALQLNDQLAEAHSSKGMLALYDKWDWEQAEQEFRRSLVIDPDYAMTHMWYAVDLAALGRKDEALVQVKKAEELDPTSPIVNAELGRVFYYARRYDEAIAAYQNVISMEPQFGRGHSRLGRAYAAKGDFGRAIEEFRKAKASPDPDPYLDGLTAYSQASLGNKKEAELLLKGMKDRAGRESIPSYSLALANVGLGNHTEAMDLLEKAFDDHSTYLLNLKVDPLLDPIRSDPRYTQLLRKMKLS